MSVSDGLGRVVKVEVLNFGGLKVQLATFEISYSSVLGTLENTVVAAGEQ